MMQTAEGKWFSSFPPDFFELARITDFILQEETKKCCNHHFNCTHPLIETSTVISCKHNIKLFILLLLTPVIRLRPGDNIDSVILSYKRSQLSFSLLELNLSMEILLETKNFTEDLRIKMKGCISMCIIMFLVWCYIKSTISQYKKKIMCKTNTCKLKANRKWRVKGQLGAEKHTLPLVLRWNRTKNLMLKLIDFIVFLHPVWSLKVHCSCRANTVSITVLMA